MLRKLKRFLCEWFTGNNSKDAFFKQMALDSYWYYIGYDADAKWESLDIKDDKDV